jgi:hypothetical protein
MLLTVKRDAPTQTGQVNTTDEDPSLQGFNNIQ